MKKEVEREIELQAFDLELGDLELLWDRMLLLFQDGNDLSATLTMSLPGERLEFNSIGELRDYNGLRGRICKFTIRMSQGKRSVMLSSGSLISDTPSVKVAADSDVWCAGALEAVTRVVRERRVWYHRLASFPFRTAFVLLSFAMFFEVGPFQNLKGKSWQFVLSWLSLFFLLGYFAVLRERLIPKATITITKELGFLRRYASEIGLLLGIVALVLSIYMWIVPYGA